MYSFIISLFILLSTIFIFVEVRSISNLVRQRRQNQANLVPYQQTSTIENHEMIGNVWNEIQPVLTDHINSHLTGSTKPGCKRTTNTKGDYIEYCLEKILNPDGKSYSTKTNAILYKTDGTIIPLHQAESNIEIETYNQ